MSLISQENFRKAQNSNFTIELNDQLFNLKLVECSDHTSNDVPDFERFSLIFESNDPLLQQSTYSLHHAELGVNDLFLVPVHGDDEVFQYEAIINRKNNSEK